MDEMDRKILNILLDDTRLSYRQIAMKMGISTATAANRIRKLEKNNVIKKYSAILDYEKLQYGIETIIFIRTFRGKDTDVMERLANCLNISAIYRIIGDFEIAILAKFENRKKLDDFLHKIRGYKFVERTNTTLILNTFKEEGVRV